ncbi:uncharacterized protein FIBRA_08875 [Fibroporia radiculosa]|uniref:Uncharacterized protein n=1 Tax=Fibroporia radiculosa TaxID=599839 RepID=J4ICL0_9APHY|nr:uncharacterized protein FIBRA_08875 [Fibroporia radiculosa]CCM06596.1 predicted protein [Fibroporia radiculosa]
MTPTASTSIPPHATSGSLSSALTTVLENARQEAVKTHRYSSEETWPKQIVEMFAQVFNGCPGSPALSPPLRLIWDRPSPLNSIVPARPPDVEKQAVLIAYMAIRFARTPRTLGWRWHLRSARQTHLACGCGASGHPGLRRGRRLEAQETGRSGRARLAAFRAYSSAA